MPSGPEGDSEERSSGPEVEKFRLRIKALSTNLLCPLHLMVFVAIHVQSIPAQTTEVRLKAL